MGIISKLFGGGEKNDENKELIEAFVRIRRILEDEELQIEIINPAMRDYIKTCPAYDRDPNGVGEYGFTEKNPIPVNGPIGELAYLSKLETNDTERLLFHRLGAIDRIDVFEAVTFSGSEWFILFVDMYHPRKSRVTPNGFRFAKEVTQFSGFHNYCADFPYDFIDKKQKDNSELIMAYIPVSWIYQQIEKRAYQRPLAHKMKLELIKERLTSMKSE